MVINFGVVSLHSQIDRIMITPKYKVGDEVYTVANVHLCPLCDNGVVYMDNDYYNKYRECRWCCNKCKFKSFESPEPKLSVVFENKGKLDFKKSKAAIIKSVHIRNKVEGRYYPCDVYYKVINDKKVVIYDENVLFKSLQEANEYCDKIKFNVEIPNIGNFTM